MKHRFTILAALLVLATSSQAEDVPLSKAFGQCVDKSGGADFAVIACLGTEYTRQDKRLNDAFRKLLVRVSKQKGEELRKVQRAWLAYIQAECGFLYDKEAFAGTADRVEASSCNVTERARRAADLESLLVRLGDK
jgi:uncharacterized protein YecT (DUF1311 family)